MFVCVRVVCLCLGGYDVCVWEEMDFVFRRLGVCKGRCVCEGRVFACWRVRCLCMGG